MTHHVDPGDLIPALHDAARKARREADRAEEVADEIRDLAIDGVLTRDRIDKAWVTVGRVRLAAELGYVVYAYLARSWLRWAWATWRKPGR